MKAFWLLSRFLAFLIPTFCAQSEEVSAYVTRVIDGDTIKVTYNYGQEAVVRLLYIDAPENGQAYGEQSATALSALILNQQVTLRFDRKDKYQRLLGEVFRGTASANKYMVKNGHAWVYREYEFPSDLPDLESTAKQERLGLWNTYNPEAPWEWRDKKDIEQLANKRKEEIEQQENQIRRENEANKLEAERVARQVRVDIEKLKANIDIGNNNVTILKNRKDEYESAKREWESVQSQASSRSIQAIGKPDYFKFSSIQIEASGKVTSINSAIWDTEREINRMKNLVSDCESEINRLRSELFRLVGTHY